MPELDDAFAEKLGIKDGGIAKMRGEIEASMKRELANRMRGVLRARVFAELLKINAEMEVPKSLIEREIERRAEAAAKQLEARGMAAADAAKTVAAERARLTDDARRQVVLGLVTSEVVEQAGIKADAATVRARIEEMAGGYDDAEAMVNWYYAEPNRLAQIEGAVLEDGVVDHLISTATVSEKPVSFVEIMSAEFMRDDEENGGEKAPEETEKSERRIILPGEY